MCVRTMGTHFFHAAYTNTDSWNNGDWSGLVNRFLTPGPPFVFPFQTNALIRSIGSTVDTGK